MLYKLYHVTYSDAFDFFYVLFSHEQRYNKIVYILCPHCIHVCVCVYVCERESTVELLNSY